MSSILQPMVKEIKRGKNVEHKGSKNLKPFKKGNQASKGHGRPKGSVSWKTLIREGLDEEIEMANKSTERTETKAARKWVVAQLIAMAIEGDFKAIKELMDREDGPVVQNINNRTTLDFTDVNLSSLSDEQLEKIIQDNKKEEAYT
jgi:hypothetical protein